MCRVNPIKSKEAPIVTPAIRDVVEVEPAGAAAPALSEEAHSAVEERSDPTDSPHAAVKDGSTTDRSVDKSSQEAFVEEESSSSVVGGKPEGVV